MIICGIFYVGVYTVYCMCLHCDPVSAQCSLFNQASCLNNVIKARWRRESQDSSTIPRQKLKMLIFSANRWYPYSIKWSKMYGKA